MNSVINVTNVIYKNSLRIRLYKISLMIRHNSGCDIHSN